MFDDRPVLEDTEIVFDGTGRLFWMRVQIEPEFEQLQQRRPLRPIETVYLPGDEP